MVRVRRRPEEGRCGIEPTSDAGAGRCGLGAKRRPCPADSDRHTGRRASVEILKISAKSAPNAVAGAIAGVIREQGEVEVQAVGAGAANQAIKSVAIARGYLAPIGIDLICTPSFASVEINGEARTAIRLIVEPR